jgi:DNA-binding transcriptional MerR regulator
MAALAAIPPVAAAKTMDMRGVVSGSPYGASNGQMAVPVLFSKQTARNTGLKSPVGVIVVKRTQRVKLPNGAGSTLPVNLRTGDRFKGRGEIGALQQRVYYPRVVFRKAVVYFRSKELSLAELSAAIESLRNSLLDLQAQLNALKASSIKAFQDLYAQLADLKKALAALQGLSVPDFQSQIDALNKKLDDLIASLPDFGQFALLSDLPDLRDYLKLSDLTTTLQSNSVITDLQSQITTLEGEVTTLTNKLDSLCTALNVPAITALGVNLSSACS